MTPRLKIAIFMIMLIGIALAAAPLLSQEKKTVDDIIFKGNRAVSNKKLLSYLPIQEGDRNITDADLAGFEILEQAYAAFGYYDARVTEVKIRAQRRNKIDIFIRVEEGQPVIVESVAYQWLPDDEPVVQLKPEPLLKKGEVASIAHFNDSVAAIRKALAKQGYALATVKESMVIDKDGYRATVRYQIDPKEICRIADIRVDGMELVPAGQIYSELNRFRGSVYTPRVETQIEESLDSFEVFRLVSVSAIPKPDTPTQVDVDVHVVEADFQRLKLGLGVQFETNKFLSWASGTYHHNNFLGRLNQFQLRTLAGWALVPELWDVKSMGPVTLLEPSIRRKGLLEHELVWNAAFALQTDVEESYKFFSPSFRPSVSRAFGKRFYLRLGYNIEYIVIYGLRDLIMEEIQRNYEDMRSPIRLANLNITARLMLTDNKAQPNNGLVLRLNYWHSGPYLGSQVAYNKVVPSASAYWRPISFFQIALRAEVGFLFPQSGSTFTGIRSNFFLGGYNTVRGWGGNRLAPWARICPSGTDVKCEKIWLGGKTMVLGNTEFRFKLNQYVFFVLFLDAGDVQYDTKTITPAQWNYATGSGVRIVTPIGKIRLDVGYRLNSPERYKSESRFGIHLGLGEAF